MGLESGVFVEDLKNALVHPLLKKADLQPINSNFRPVSNLQFTSKIVEKSVAIQMQDPMDGSQQLISRSPERVSSKSQHRDCVTESQK